MFFKRKPPADLRAPIARRVRDLELLSSRMIRSGFAGDYHSAFHGQGIEFAQVREYMPGDDIRTIDWNVTARSGVPHVKQFVEERDLTVMIAVDVSGSMGFGSVDWRKCDIAAELASVFAFSAVENSDRAGLLLFSENTQTFIPPRRGRAHAQVLVRAAVEAAMRGPRGEANLEQAARFLERVAAKRAVVLVLSDFLDLHFERPLNRLNRKHDVIALPIVDPREERFPEGGLARLIDLESGEPRLVDLGRADVARRAAQRRVQLERRFRVAGIDHLSVSTAVPYDRELLRFFKQTRGLAPCAENRAVTPLLAFVLAAVTATVHPPAPKVGDLITLEFAAPVVLDASADYEVVSREGNRVVVRTFAPKPFAMSGAVGAERFRNLVVPVKSVLAEKDTLTPAPLAPPVRVPYPREPFVAIGIAAAVALAIWSAVWWRARHPAAQKKVQPAISAEERFRKAVLALRQNRAHPRRWAALADETRAFLAATRHLGNELTTTELLPRLAAHDRIAEEILRHGDVEKFAPAGTPRAEFDEIASRALALAEPRA